MKNLTTVKLPYLDDEVPATKNTTIWLWVISLCIVVFLLSIVISVAPLQRAVGVPLLSQNTISVLLTRVGAWLPADFHVLRDVQQSRITTGNGEFLLLIALAFIAYGLCAWCIRYKLSPRANYTYVCIILAGGIATAGVIFLFTPALLSQDIFVYADYGRTIVAHHSNPYFVPPLQSSWSDPLTKLDMWNAVINAYGPLWLYLCSFLSLLLGDEPIRYIFAFRVLGLLIHILNIVLIIAILRAMGQSRRTVVLAAFLYGCNPLVLVESCLDAHNDAFMVTFILLSIWLVRRAEQQDFTQFKRYALPLLAITMAVLIKFTSAPLVVLFLVLLARKTLIKTHANAFAQRWLSALFNVYVAGVFCGLMIVLFYMPFWIGHSIPAIVKSFSLAPSSYFAENSLLRVFYERVKAHGFPPHTSWLYWPIYVLYHRKTWDIINMVILIGTLGIGANLLWRVPTTRSMIFAALVVFEAVLIVTPWFYSWYVLWIVALAALLLTEHGSNTHKMVILFALVFSASAFFTYIMPYYLQSFDRWGATRYLLTDSPPVLVLLGFLVIGFVRRKWVR